MILSNKDWIKVGIGSLYFAPFLSRFMLFRLYDSESSLLICQSVPCSSSEARPDKNTLVITATAIWPNTVSVHFMATTAIPVLDLLALPPTQLQLSDRTATVSQFGHIQLCLESYAIPVSNKRIVAVRQSERKVFDIADSAFAVSGNAHVSRLQTGILLEGTRMRCWKVSLRNLEKGIDYDLNTTGQWSLMAFEMDESQPPRCEMRLEMNGGKIHA
jgi:hypothetical protein